jgi:glyoxylase I family protein
MIASLPNTPLRYNLPVNSTSLSMSKHNFTIHHASLLVSDTQKSLEFYCGVLGLQQIERPPLPFPGAWLALGQQQIHLLELDNPDPTTGRPAHGGRDRHVAMMIDSYDALREDFLAAGVEHTLSISGRRALFTRDPDGNALEFIERT